MNERIKMLALQAFGSTIDNDPILVYEAETFAQLIVKECISALDEADGSVHHRECLLEYFGVEE